MITLTNSALTAVKKFMAGADTPVAGLRIMVAGGGCSGMQYSLRLEEKPQTDDAIFEYEGLAVYVDPMSSTMLEGVKVDFVDGLEGSGFKFENPNATGTCGCGNSFAV